MAVTGFTFGLVNKVTGEPVTAGVTTGYVTINGGTQRALTNTPVHEGNGQWSVNLTAEEMNGEVIGLAFSNPGAVPCFFTIRTTGCGTNIVTVAVQDSLLAPIPGADIYVYDATDTVYLTSGTTNTSGHAVFTLDDGTYSLHIRKIGSSFTTPETLVVAGTTEETYYGSTVSVGIPEDSEACRVYEYCYDLASRHPIQDVSATAYIYKTPYYKDDKGHYSKKVAGTYDPETGLLYWDIIQGATVKISIPAIGYNDTIIVPEASTAMLSDL